ncbi:metallophosphoesterase family protein [Aquabacter spiritensis]|uniref:3',5'-cyclic AMP phosphodiesterase CpdA n=1 Tax=Aquabacter spiritensis TaxID=933073 RepID=A0A4R3LY31_9HYPH|nr:metallophosphoesterase [Aquabacter spiritensis]TCT05562.1 3',5'-cyclic AMP phosphodiesterase CpdA [Aquabacter spiritensis]
MFVLAHLSDPHLGPIPEARISELLGKRFFGMMNWIGARRRNFGQATLATLMADLLGQPLDHIAVTGDLVNVSLPAEFDTGATFLASLGPADKVTVIPGNHDTYVHSALSYHLEHWAPFLSGDESHPDTPLDVESFPFVRRRGPVAIVGVSTAIPTAAFLASGEVGDAQLGRLAAILGRLKEEGLFRVVLIHHPPVGERHYHRDLRDAPAFRRVIAEAGAELVLHGHDHRASLGHIRSGDAMVPVVGVPSASAGPDDSRGAGRYNIYRIGGTPGAWTCSMEARGYAPGDATVKVRDQRDLLAPA